MVIGTHPITSTHRILAHVNGGNSKKITLHKTREKLAHMSIITTEQ